MLPGGQPTWCISRSGSILIPEDAGKYTIDLNSLRPSVQTAIESRPVCNAVKQHGPQVWPMQRNKTNREETRNKAYRGWDNDWREGDRVFLLRIPMTTSGVTSPTMPVPHQASVCNDDKQSPGKRSSTLVYISQGWCLAMASYMSRSRGSVNFESTLGRRCRV